MLVGFRRSSKLGREGAEALRHAHRHAARVTVRHACLLARVLAGRLAYDVSVLRLRAVHHVFNMLPVCARARPLLASVASRQLHTAHAYVVANGVPRDARIRVLPRGGQAAAGRSRHER